MKTKLKGTIEFKVNEEKRTVACKLVAHGKNFFGIAKCLDTDTFDVEKGKVLAQMRATIKQRSFDLKLTRQFITILRIIIKELQKILFWMCFATFYAFYTDSKKKKEKAQLAHIRDLKRRIKEF